MWCATSARPSLTGLPDPGPRAGRGRRGAGLAFLTLLVGMALAVEAPSRATPTPAAPSAPIGLLTALGLQPPAPRAAVPDFALRDLAGRPVSRETLRDRVVLLSFFATWCPTCTAEFPALRGLAERFRDTDFVLLLVSYGESPDAVRPLARDLGFAHGVLLDPRARAGDALDVKFLPTHFLIGRRGNLVATGIGPKAWDGPEATRLIRSLLGARG